jgi:hypothetical protein
MRPIVAVSNLEKARLLERFLKHTTKALCRFEPQEINNDKDNDPDLLNGLICRRDPACTVKVTPDSPQIQHVGYGFVIFAYQQCIGAR